ncbi:lamin tail domain-containing protein [bacterium]|nr:lamin tail domain-containing protein [bacterium]
MKRRAIGQTRIQQIRPGRTDRGSTILLVIAILSLLVLMAITLSFTSRLEIASADNFASGVQNRIASLTGVDSTSLLLANDLPEGPSSRLDLSLDKEFLKLRPGKNAEAQYVLALNEPEALGREESRSLIQEGTTRQPRVLRPLVGTETSMVSLFDASAKININAADEVVLARFFDALGDEANISVNGKKVAAAIIDIRYGPDGMPGAANVDDDFDKDESERLQPNEQALNAAGLVDHVSRDPKKLIAKVREDVWVVDEDEEQARSEWRQGFVTGVDEADEYIADIRLPAYGDDVRFSSVQDLLNYPKITGAGVSRELLNAGSIYMTTLSISKDERLVDLQPDDKVDLNTATPIEIYNALKKLYKYEAKDDAMLQQFAVNVVDARDFDRIPTVFPGTGGTNRILGVERTPYIVEAYANSLTPDEEGDDGQYVEIYNPWDEDFDLTGWKLVGAGEVVSLNGRIKPKGFVLITDDFDNSADELDYHTPGTGSVYDIFDVVANTASRRSITAPGFNLLHSPGAYTLSLFDDDGNLIDSMTYKPDSDDDGEGLLSYQRVNPMVREATKLHANPFDVAPRDELPDTQVLRKLRNYPMDGPFVSPADVFQVFAGYAPENGGEGIRWNFPALATPRSADLEDVDLAKKPSIIDARLLDVFTVKLPRLQSRESTEMSKSEADRLAEEMTGQELAHYGEMNFAHGWDVRHGRINLNTTLGMGYVSLPGIDWDQAEDLMERRAELEQDAQDGLLEDGVLYRGLSDVLVDDTLFGDAPSDDDRLARFRTLLPHITLSSEAFLLVGQPKVEPDSPEGIQQATRIEALVTLDRGAPEYVYWHRLAP